MIFTLTLTVLYTAPKLLMNSSHAAFTLSRSSWIRMLKEKLFIIPSIHMSDKIQLANTSSHLTTVILPPSRTETGILLEYSLIYSNPNIYSTFIGDRGLYNNIPDPMAQIISELDKDKTVPIFNGELTLIDSKLSLKEHKPRPRVRRNNEDNSTTQS